MQTARELRVDVDGTAIVAIGEPATSPDARALFVFAHGAGGHMSDRAMLATSALLRERGIDVVRFDFPYRAGGRRMPDRMPVLMKCVERIAAAAVAEIAPARLLIGGRSMGGRAASMLAAQGFACDGMLLFAYPLHPAGAPDKLRDAHLPDIDVPVLCFNGTADALCDRAQMEQVLTRVGPRWHMHWLDGADHSFHVRKSSGRTDADVLREVGAAIDAWLPDVPLSRDTRGPAQAVRGV